MGQLLKKHKWAILYLSLIFLSSLFVVFVSYYKPANPIRFEVINFTGAVEIYDHDARQWRRANRGDEIRTLDKIRTRANSEIDFTNSEQGLFRLGADSELHGNQAFFLDMHPMADPGIHLKNGSLMIYALKRDASRDLKIVAPFIQVKVLPGSLLFMEVDALSDEPKAWVGVLRGGADVYSKLLLKQQTVRVNAHEQTEVQQGSPLSSPVRITRAQWQKLSKGFELVERTLTVEREPVQEFKAIGNLFEYVFDYGTFYTPNQGSMLLDFLRDDDGKMSGLVLDYDVFPPGSYVGVYLKSRSLDLSHFQNFELELRSDDFLGIPDAVNVEFKTHAGVIHEFPLGAFKDQWHKVSFPLNYPSMTDIVEIAIVFTNQTVGEHKSGSLEARNFKLIRR